MEKVSRQKFQALRGRPADDGERLEDVFEGWVSGAEVECIHCGESFLLGQELVDLRDGLLVCPTDGCDGSPIDWHLTVTP